MGATRRRGSTRSDEGIAVWMGIGFYASAHTAYTVTAQLGLPWFFRLVTVHVLLADGYEPVTVT
jgi:hypothetical protein